MEQEFHGVQPSGAQAVDRAAQLLSLVLSAETPRPLGELADSAGLPKSTTSRLLGALESHGLVKQDGARGAFQAGPVLVRFAHRGLVDRNLLELAQQPMHALSEATGETINLAVAGPTGVEHLGQVESRHFLGAGQWIGRHVAYHCSANGKVLLAFGAAALPDDAPLEALTSRTVVDRARLDAELATVRAEHFATAADELESGLTALAAPVFDASGAAIAALSVSGPTMRLRPARVSELQPVVIKQARVLSEQLGHRPEGVPAA